MIQRIDTRTQTAMQTKDAIAHDGRHGQIIKGIRKGLPHIGVTVFAQTLVVKSVHLRNLSTLVVAPQNGNAMTVPNLEGDKESDSLQ